MVTKAVRIRAIALLVPFFLLAAAMVIFAEGTHQETIAALQAVYLDESRAQVRYAAFAKKALAEGYPQIAYFFTALSASERIHARNAREMLVELGGEVEEELFEPDVGTTRENLKSGTSSEIEAIERLYPGYLEKMTPENHAVAICTLTNELETERQHLDLLKKIQKGTGVFFGMLVKKFEGTPVEYFVCQVCGATTIEHPRQACPICKADVAEYKAIERNF